MAVKNIATQGRPVPSHRQWVKSYEISTSVGGTEWAKSGAYDQEHATPLYFCHGVFIDRFIFKSHLL